MDTLGAFMGGSRMYADRNGMIPERGDALRTMAYGEEFWRANALHWSDFVTAAIAATEVSLAAREVWRLESAV